jgi:WS/DGAT/MGAT family acyltransferase
MQPLSALDASFIYLETDHSPMHVGSVYVLDAAEAPAAFGYEAFRAHIASRLRCSRIFRQRLVEVPLGLSHPCWVKDPEFDLDLHLPRRRLIAPGGREELMAMAADLFARRLDRSRPLWEFNFIEGLDGVPGLARGSFALVSKVHHAAIDGISGAEIIGATLDATPEPAAAT